MGASTCCSRPVSRVLYGSVFCKRISNRFPSFILSQHHCGDRTTYPPASDEQPLLPVYMVFQPIRCTASGVAIGTGELLPRLFTLTPLLQNVKPGRLFSVTLLYPHGYLPVRKHGALCCPDFPSRFSLRKSGTMERPAAMQRYEKRKSGY